MNECRRQHIEAPYLPPIIKANPYLQQQIEDSEARVAAGYKFAPVDIGGYIRVDS